MMHEDKETGEKIVSFQQMNLQPNLQLALKDFGFSWPTESQRLLIQSIQQRRDVVFIASAGTGKTFGSIISLLQIIDPNLHKCQAIYLCPCREVARRTLIPIVELTEHSQYATRIFTGGSSPRQDRQALLKENVKIAVGTPGRILDMIKRTLLKVDEVKVVVMDEADELFARGFRDQLKEIFELASVDVTVLVASCTMGNLDEIFENLLRDPVHIVQKRGAE